MCGRTIAKRHVPRYAPAPNVAHLIALVLDVNRLQRLEAPMLRNSLTHTTALLALFALAACGDDASGGPDRDAATDTSGVGDDTSTDAGTEPDDTTAQIDTTEEDTTTDVGSTDTTPLDTVGIDTAPSDVAEDTTVVEDTTVETDTATPDASTSAGACDNEADTAALAGATDLQGTIGSCAFSCISTGATCAADCVQTEVGTSDECSACFGDVISCTITNCALQCLDASSAGCATCRDTNCTPAFENCAGIVQP